MKIENLKSEKLGDRKRASAKVIWEESDRPAQEIYFETKEKFAEDLSCNPHAFLVGSILPAMHNGEKRIYIDEEICPELRDGLTTAMAWIRTWSYKPEDRPLRIEAKTGPNRATRVPGDRAGCFFSGGIDGLATIRLNRLEYPLGHPGSIKDALIMFGPYWESNDRVEIFEQALIELSNFAQDAGIELIPVYTNIRDLDRDTMLFIYEYHGAMLASVAHAFASRFRVITISATDDIPSLLLLRKKNFRVLGSHPLLDPNYSSSDLQIKHVGLTLNRLEKTNLLRDWDVALNSIKVCQPNWPGANCGRCEKCVRTELALLALGLLHKTNAFPLDDVTSEHIEGIRLGSNPEEKWTAHHQYLELIPYLDEKGRHDLVRAIKRKIGNHYKKEKMKKRRSAYIDPIVKFDQENLGGTLRKLKRLVYTKGIWN